VLFRSEFCVTREKEIASLSQRIEELEKIKTKLTRSQKQESRNPTSSADRKKILVADPSEHVRRGIIDLLTSYGHQVVGEADTGAKAVYLFEEKRPGIVTIDLEMPGIDGIEATRRIKAIDPETKVVIISRIVQKNVILKAIDAGVTEFLAKPLQLSRLIDLFERLAA
jgi:two-component system, chemotaxis family, chemotaxis protein CheY